MRPRTIRHILVAFAVWLRGPESFCQVIYEKKLPEGEPGRYEVKDYVESYISDGLIKAYKATETVLRLEIKDGRLHVREFRDLKKAAELAAEQAARDKWRREFSAHHVIADKIGDFLYTGSGGAQKYPGGEFVRFDLSGPEIEWADALYRRKEDENVWACVYRLEGTEVTPHDVLRKVIRGKCSVAKCSSGVYVKSEVPEGPEWRTWYAWRSQGSLLVLVCSVACDPQQVAFKYLERYPSDLPKELKIEKLEWGRAEMDYCLGLMNQMFEAANPDSYPLSSARCFEFLARNVLIPPDVARIQYDDPVPKRREAFERLKKWWDENKEKSYWHKGYQKLAVKGYTPEELAEVEQKRREAEIKAKLDAELTEDDLKRITPAVVNKLEAWMQHVTDVTNNTIGADSGCKFERIGDAEWHRYYRQCKECVLHRVTITGPTLRKWRDRRCPLIAEFRCVDRNMDTGKDTEWKTVYTYWRLEDRWSEGPPPK